MSMMGIAIDILAFGATLAVFIGVSAPLIKRFKDQTNSARKSHNVLLDSPVAPLVLLLAPVNTRLFSDDYRSVIEKKLLHAGQPGGDISAKEYLAAAELAGIAVFLLFSTFGLILGLSLQAIVFALALGVFITWLSIAFIDNLVSERRRRITRQFPYFLDLTVMAMEAGSNLLESIEIYSRDNPGQALSEDLTIVLHEVRMGKTLQEALDDFYQRTDTEGVRQTIRAIQQGERMGTPLGQVLRDQLLMIRFERSQQAERAAEELKVKMLGPAMLMMVSVMVLMLAPAILAVVDSGIF